MQNNLVTWNKENETAILNRFALRCYALITISLLAIQLWELQNKQRGIGFFLICCALQWIPWLISGYIYTKKDKGFHAIMDLLGCGFAFYYSVEVLFTDNQIAYLFVIPLLIIVMCYCNLRFSAICSGGVFIVNLIDEGIKISRGVYTEAELEKVMVKLIFILFISAFIVMSAKIMIQINQMKLDMITREKETSEQRSVTILELTEQMNGEIQQVLEVMQQLGKAVNSTKDSVNQVHEGTNETVDSVNVQLEKTGDIDKQIAQLNQVTLQLSENMKHTLAEVNDGKESISELIHQAKETKAASSKVSNEMEHLNVQVENLQSVVDIIQKITKQTSMLSLNASIEAARAGEAGKGFAVVAKEISDLSVQTQDATVNITNTIQNIAEELAKVVAVVNQMIQMSEVQNNAASKTAESMDGIVVKIDQVNEYSHNLNSVVELIEVSNKSIIESIQTISGIAKDVYDNTTVTSRISEESSDVVKQVISYVDALDSKAQELRELG